MNNTKFDEKMSTKDETLMHLQQFKGLIEATIEVEALYRERLYKRKPVNLDEMLYKSLSYQRFLERMINDVFDDITL